MASTITVAASAITAVIIVASGTDNAGPEPEIEGEADRTGGGREHADLVAALGRAPRSVLPLEGIGRVGRSGRSPSAGRTT